MLPELDVSPGGAYAPGGEAGVDGAFRAGVCREPGKARLSCSGVIVCTLRRVRMSPHWRTYG